MAGERLARILAQLSARPGTVRLCEVCADVTNMSGAGIMLVHGGVDRGSLCTTNEVSALIEQLQYTLGEGPGVDACHQGGPVLEPDLADPATARWLAFSPGAVEAGARAIFSFPVRLGAVRLGALDLYRDAPGPLSTDQHADALAMTDVVAKTVLAMQAQAPAGALAVEFDAGTDFHYVVHQASGMVAAQLGVSLGQALIRLRAYAFGHDRPLAEVAEEVVGRRLHLD